MVNVALLKEKIWDSGMTYTELCKRIRMSEVAFLWKMKHGAFKTNEAERIAAALELENPEIIFFNKN